MLKNLRAKPLKQGKIVDGFFELKPNQPIQICKQNNSIIARLYEEKEQENCDIHSSFSDESSAVICKEFYLNFLNDPKKVDLSYYYFSESGQAIVYLYDMKKTFAGIDDLIHLVEQWKSSIIDAKYCIEKTEDYALDCAADIHLGVITEDNDVERRNRELEAIFDPTPPPQKLPSYLKQQHQADQANQMSKAKVLVGFDKGKVTIGGITYVYDIRTFINKQHDMYFNDGCLESQAEE